MDAVQRRRGLTLGRLILLAVLAGVAWCALSIFASSSTASADESRGSGLLGTVTQTVSDAGDVVGSVDTVVTSVAQTAAPAVAPVPAPVAEPVAEVVQTAVATVDEAVSVVDESAVGAVDSAAQAVGEASGAGVVGQVVEPVADLVGSVPVVGELVDATGADTVLTGTAGAVDTMVDTVIGTPGSSVGSVLPEPPLTGVDVIVDTLLPAEDSALPVGSLPLSPSSFPLVGDRPEVATVVTPSSALPGSSVGPPSAGGARVSAPEASGASASASPSGTPLGSGPSLGGIPGGALAPGSASSASGQGASGGVAALAHEDGHGSVYDFMTLRSSTDDALPGSPVFDSDVSPD